MTGGPGDDILRKLFRAMIEGVFTAVVFTAAVFGAGLLLGLDEALGQPSTSLIIVAMGALGLLLTGRLSVKTFDER